MNEDGSRSELLGGCQKPGAQSAELLKNPEHDKEVDSVVSPENDRLEYKSLRTGIKQRDMSVDEVVKMFRKGGDSKQKEFNAMLNYGGGKVQFGIGEIKQSDGSKKCVVELGIKLTEEEKEKINDAIHQMFHEFYPSCSSDRGDYEVKWKMETDKGGDKRYRFTVIIHKCSAYKRDDIVFMMDNKVYTRSGSASVQMSAEVIKEKLGRARGDFGGMWREVLWTQASIDARLIQRLRDALDKYEDKEIGATDIIRILKQYATEIDRQRYKSYILVEEILNFMEKLACMLRYETTKIEIALAILNLGDSIYYVHICNSSQWYSRSDSELGQEAGDNKCLKNLTRNIIVPLFEVCFSIAHDGVKYRREENVFTKATALLAKIQSTLQSAPTHEKDDEHHRCIKDLGRRYDQLLSSILESRLDALVQNRLLRFHQLALERYVETDPDEQFCIEKSILELDYLWY